MRCGVWRHYKGESYLVIGLARSHADDRELVIYARLYPRAQGGLPMSARAREDFEELVEWPDGSRRPRFEWLGEEEPAKGS